MDFYNPPRLLILLILLTRPRNPWLARLPASAAFTGHLLTLLKPTASANISIASANGENSASHGWRGFQAIVSKISRISRVH